MRLCKKGLNILSEKKLNPDLWKPVGFEQVELPPDCAKYPPKKNSFLDYQAPEDRYEVRGIMPKAPSYPKKTNSIL